MKKKSKIIENLTASDSVVRQKGHVYTLYFSLDKVVHGDTVTLNSPCKLTFLDKRRSFPDFWKTKLEIFIESI